MNIEYVLTGTQPLLMHHDNIEGSDFVKAWIRDPENKNISTAGDDRTPAWTWQTYCYNDGEHLAIPSENIMSCLKTAGTRKIMQKQKTFKEATQAGILIPTEFVKFEVGGKQVPWQSIEAMRDKDFKTQYEEVKKLGFLLFMKRAVIGKSKHVRVRPRFEEWKIQGEADIITPELTLEVLKEIFNLAGRVGLGDWRPGCKSPGPFGQFSAKIRKI